MVITRFINLSLVELNKEDLKELDDYKKTLKDGNGNHDIHDEHIIESFSNSKLKELTKKSINSETFLNSSYNKKKKEKFKDTKTESISDYYKRIAKIDAKWSSNSRDVIKKFFKFKDEFVRLF